MKYSLEFHPSAVHLWTPIYIQVFIVNYLKAHASIGVSIDSIEYVMRILSGADCRDEAETNEIFDKFSTRKAPNDDINA